MSTGSVPLFYVYHDAAMDQAATQVLHSRQIAAGPQVPLFEREFGELVGQSHVVTVNDMSNALQIALRLAGVEPGDEVLSSTFACLSTNAPVAMVGAQSRWVDVDPATGSMAPEALRRAITPRAKAVIVYHLAGYPARIAEIAAICDEHGLTLIEDCDNALLANIDGRPVGSWGDFAIYSFYPNRQINASEGGAIACRRPEDAQRARRLRRYGIDMASFRDAWGEITPRSDITEIGFAATLNQLCAALGRCQIAGVRARIDATRHNAEVLAQRLKSIPNIEPVPVTEGARPAYWALLLRVRQRDAVMHQLKTAGVQCSTLHLRNDLYTAFGGPADLPGTAAFTAQVLAVPCGWWLSEPELERIVTSLQTAAA